MSMTALGATAMSRRIRDAMVAFAEQGCRFLALVFVGDQITPHFTVESIQIKSGKDTALVALTSISSTRLEFQFYEDTTRTLSGFDRALISMPASRRLKSAGHSTGLGRRHLGRPIHSCRPS
jgi:hypothetical protein